MRKQTYIHGSAVRKEIPKEIQKEKRQPERQIRVVKKQPKAEIAKQPGVKPGKYSAVHVMLLLLIVAFAGTFIAGYIKLNSDVITYQEQCASLEKQYEKIKTSNDLYEDRITNSVDLAEIERIAVCELGMKLAGKGQIVVYSGEIEDYVKQYTNLPQ